MIVDSSALIVLIQREDTADKITEIMSSEARCCIGAPTWTETMLVLTHRYGPLGRTVLERVRQEYAVAVVDYTADHAAVALDAFLRFGKGRHNAALNFGDCMSYAVARYAIEPLLAVGDDFPHTDLVFAADGLVGHWVKADG